MKDLQSVIDLVQKKLKGVPAGFDHGAIDPSASVHAFLARAPHNFTDTASKDELAAICFDGILLAHEIASTVGTESPEKSVNAELVRITVSSNDESTSLLIVMPDRPFIVNTISECFTDLEINPTIFLHPIIKYQSHRYSCSYLRFSKLKPETEKTILALIRESLGDLLLITSDFSEMQQEMRSLTENLLGGLEGTREADYETPQFLEWLSDDNFVFLGLRKFSVNLKTKSSTDVLSYGMFRSHRSVLPHIIEETNLDGISLLEKKTSVFVSRLQSDSPVHRMVPMVNITVRAHDADGKSATLYSIPGLLTSKARGQESAEVPLIRHKLQKLIELEGLVFNSHDYKYIVNIIDTMPKDEALRLDVKELQENVHLILEMQHSNDIRASFRYTDARRGVSVLVVMPRERFNSQVRQKVQHRVEELFGAKRGTSEYHLNYTNKPLVRFYFYLPLPPGAPEPPTIEVLQDEIADQTRSWSDTFIKRLPEQFPRSDISRIERTYAHCFNAEYQALYTAEDAIEDIIECEKISAENPIGISLFSEPTAENPNYVISVYSHSEQITVSRALPILDNMGFDVINENSSLIVTQSRKIFIHRFSVHPKSNATLAREHFDGLVAPALVETFRGDAETDSLNSLIIDAGINARSIALLRVYCALLWQITKFASRQAIFDSLTAYPDITKKLWELFRLRFDPEVPLTLGERAEHYQVHLDTFKDELRDVNDITKDRILRGLASLLSASIRTNFYQNTDRIAIKFRSREVDLMPNPRPLFEIFMRSKLTEGVHLRNGPVSRGGIRWSDRVEDFRSEVLGLMATQTMKNVLIVPDGAKGGFIVRQMPKAPAEVPAAVQNAYRDFIRAILSISDNRVGDTIQKPTNVVCWDEDDPYLVVAADKGTAALSDTANGIAVDEFSFWLDDAFASGGSFGYDHKKYGITAKGAWESTRRHFSDLGFDFEQHSFTAIGIGDMSGDVFGNGMLLSKTVKLIGAFDHRHVFVDPDPDPARAFAERSRLFQLPRSQWTDYDRSIMSAGSGIFGRYEKEITLTKEVREALGVDASVPAVVSGEELISLILKAPVDLFFNGGIGTYVKAASQSHTDVNDGTNDRVRIDATDLRAKIVVEGGNLGLTQKARVEYAENGGRLNTDAIDNSAGVDLSDHEVNLKILFGELMRSKKLTREQRDKMMVEISGEVVDLVLADNRIHALLLSIAINRSRRNISYFHSLITRMVKMGYVTRHRDSLPDDDALNERAAKKMGLVRPELAVCLAAAKRWMKISILATTLPRHPLLQRHLTEYFPATLQKRYPQEILAHPLAENIIATQLTNYLVNSTGVSFLHRMCLKHSVAPEVVITCTLAADIIIGSESIQKALWQFDTAEKSAHFLTWWMSNGDTVREATSWLIRNHGVSLSLQQMIDLYQVRFQTLVNHAEDIFSGDDQIRYQQRLETLLAEGLPTDIARRLALFPEIVRILEMLWSSMQSHHSIPVATGIYGQILENLELVRVLQLEARIDTATKWESELLSHSYDEIRHSVSLLTVKLLNKNITGAQEIARAIKNSPNYEQLASTLAEIEGAIPSVTALAVIARQLSLFNPVLH